MKMVDEKIEDEKPTGWRGSRELWLRAAKDAFIEAGLDAVKIQPLASQLNISRTSFYWFFKDRGDLLGELLEDWETKNTGAFIDACNAYAETISEANLNLIAVFLDEAKFESRLDFAIRGWAHQSEPVMARVVAADRRRLQAIKLMFERFGTAPQDAEVRAQTIYLTQIGYISMQVREDLQTRMQRIPKYVEIFSGRRPTDSELARFYARFRYTPA